MSVTDKENDKKTIVTNAKIAIIAQIITLLIGFIKSLIIPGLLTVEEFGYWQIYLLYLPYIGLFYWGFNDGIYLRYGGYNEQSLPYEKIRSSIKIFATMLMIETVILCGIIFFCFEKQELIALMFVALNICIQGIYGTIIYVLQITNRIKKYSLFSVVDKIIFVIFLGFFIFDKERSYLTLIIADIVSRLIVTIIMMFYNKELFIGKHSSLKIGIKEYSVNITTGISLMLASFISMLFTGLGKIFVANGGDINNYAYYSFGMSLINLLLVCFTSISTVMYPILKRMNSNSASKQYDNLNDYYEVVCVIGMLGYFICHLIIKEIYIKYMPVLEYLNILFLLAIFQGKITLLNNTYYKVLREEKKMLIDNAVSMILFAVLCFFFCDSVYKVALLTCLVMLHRSIDSEFFLRGIMNNKEKNRIGVLFCIVFIFFVTSSLTVYNGLILYSLFVIVYLYKRQKIFISMFKMIFSNKK